MPRPARHVRAAPATPRVLALALAAAALTAGCQVSDARGEGLPDDQPESADRLVVRTPAPLSPDLPYATPPLRVEIPGPGGGLPGDVPQTVPPASPGADEEG